MSSSVESVHQKNVALLFLVTAALELGAGGALLVGPAEVIRLLFGAAVELFPATGIVRLTGLALLSIGAACWWARDDARSAASRAVVRALLIYNAGVLTLVLFGGLGPLGVPQWAAVAIHGAMAIWCARVIVW